MATTHVLGKDAVLTINGAVAKGVRSVTIDRTTNEFDATGFGHGIQSAIAIHRSWELTIEVIDKTLASALVNYEVSRTYFPVTVQDGFVSIASTFMVAGFSIEEPLDDAVSASFHLKQWGWTQ